RDHGIHHRMGTRQCDYAGRLRQGERPDAPLTRPASLCTMPRRHPSTDRASAVSHSARRSAPTPLSTTPGDPGYDVVRLFPGRRPRAPAEPKVDRGRCAVLHTVHPPLTGPSGRSLVCGRRPLGPTFLTRATPGEAAAHTGRDAMVRLAGAWRRERKE